MTWRRPFKCHCTSKSCFISRRVGLIWNEQRRTAQNHSLINYKGQRRKHAAYGYVCVSAGQLSGSHDYPNWFQPTVLTGFLSAVSHTWAFSSLSKVAAVSLLPVTNHTLATSTVFKLFVTTYLYTVLVTSALLILTPYITCKRHKLGFRFFPNEIWWSISVKRRCLNLSLMENTVPGVFWA